MARQCQCLYTRIIAIAIPNSDEIAMEVQLALAFHYHFEIAIILSSLCAFCSLLWHGTCVFLDL